MEYMLDRVVYTDFTLHSVFTVNSHLTKVVSVKFASQLRLCAVLCETTKQMVNLNVHQDGGRPNAGILEKYWRQKLTSLKTQCHAITNKYEKQLL
jgi:hypothetical protein